MKKSKRSPTFRCESCLIEIPSSAAFTPEGIDYVVHFCGPACFEKWKTSKAEGKQK